ncbi:MAG: helix-turn-helix domain-containing protein [Parvibaculaceae bacterium]
MSVADNAVWIIERNLREPLSLVSLAQSCGVSRSHLANAFGTATGQSVIRYLRARRLSEAARALALGAPDILAVALDAGYGSHEAFTRAFREQFGRTPESVRDRKAFADLAIVRPLELKTRAAIRLDPPRLVAQDRIRAVGLCETHSFATTIEIPAQWQHFMELCSAITDKLDHIPIGVSQACDDNGGITYVCAAEVSRFGAIPEGLVKVDLPPRNYAVFEHKGHVSRIFETYNAIWNTALEGRKVTDAPVVERHNPTFDPGTGEGGLTLWIPLAA